MQSFFHKNIREIKSGIGKPLAVRMHGAVKKSRYTVNLKGANPLEQAAAEIPKQIKIIIKPEKYATKHTAKTKTIAARPKIRAGIIWTKTRAKMHTAKSFLGFAVLTALLVGPVPVIATMEKIKQKKEIIEFKGEAVVESVKNTGNSLKIFNLEGAEKNLGEVLESIASFENEMAPATKTLAQLPGGGALAKIKSVENLTHGLRSASIAALEFIYGLKQMDKDAPPSETISDLNNLITTVLPRLEDARKKFAEVNAELVQKERLENLETAKLAIEKLTADLKAFSELNSILQNMMGAKNLKRYLILFQNNAELRPAGGFIGSLALLDVKDGKVANIEIPGGGPYDFQGHMKEYLEPPPPLLLVNKRWELQDSNWFPDFPVSAQTAKWFYERSGGPTVDGVIAINFKLVEKIFRHIGELELEDGTKITSENLYSEIQQRVDLSRARDSGKPKRFISQLAPLVLKQIISQKDPQKILAIFSDIIAGAASKDIQAYFQNPDIQAASAAFGVDGSVKSIAAETDYLMVVNANVGGGKTDSFINQIIEHQARIMEDGSIIDTVMVKRHYRSEPDNQWNGPENINYMRVYSPKGSELIEAMGFNLPPEENFNASEDWYEKDIRLKMFETAAQQDKKTGTLIGEEFDKTVFGHWTRTKPGETTMVRFTYKLPFRAFNQPSKNKIKNLIKAALSIKEEIAYSIFYQKQSGTLLNGLKTKIVLPEDFKTVWTNDSGMGVNQNIAVDYGALDTDIYRALIAEK